MCSGEDVPACSLDLWHEPLPMHPCPTGGYISANGHFFQCDHQDGEEQRSYHTYFIIDRSGSMGDPSVQPNNPQLLAHPSFVAGQHLNKLGVVLQAILNYAFIRASHSSEDLVTLIAFDDKADVIAAQLSCSSTSELLDNLLKVRLGGRTMFREGLKKAFTTLRPSGFSFFGKKEDTATRWHQPVFVLLTDSGVMDRQNTLSYLEKQMDKEHTQQNPVTLHALGFGEDVDDEFMQDLAEKGNGSFHTIKDISNQGDVARWAFCCLPDPVVRTAKSV